MDIIYFSQLSRHSLPQRHYHLTNALAKENRLLFVEPPENIIYWLHKKRWREPRGLQRVADIDGNMFLLWVKPSIPFKNYNSLINYIGYRYLKNIVTEASTKLNFSHPIIWLTFPSQHTLIEQFKDEKKCYDCLDDYISLVSHKNTKLYRKWEDKILNDVDLTIVTHPLLYEAKKNKTKRIALVPNAVDFMHFNKVHIKKEKKPLENIIVGYWGRLEWLDWPLIKELAEQLVQYSFIFVGPLFSTIPSNIPTNVFLLGPKPYEELPNLAENWDIFWIPFRDCKTVRHTDPVKLYEYMATGKPVVVTDAIGFKNKLIYNATKKEDYMDAFLRCIKNDSDELRRLRKEFSQENSWGSRAQVINILLMNL